MSGGLILGLSAAALWAVIFAVSVRRPGRGPWPPRRGNLVTAVWAWVLTAFVYVGLSQTWGQPTDLPAWLRYGIGLPLAIAGGILHSWATAVHGLAGTCGWDVGVVTRGPYRVSRHPQYLGQIGSIVGIALFIGSPEALILGLAGPAVLVYGSYVEDRIMAALHPDAFAQYSAYTPFLLPFPSRR